jgi:hypothetical protein
MLYQFIEIFFSYLFIQKKELTEMKKLLIIPVFLLIFKSSHAQKWIDIGAKGMFNSTWILNSNINNDKYAAYDMSFGYGGGGKIGFNFNERNEVTLDILYSTINQKYHSDGVLNKWSRELNLAYLDLPLLYKSNKEGTYIEIGPQFSFLMSAKEKFGFENKDALLDYERNPADQYYEKKNIAAVFGFGSYLFGSENMYVVLGMRVTYGFLDIVSDEGGKGKEYSPITTPDNSNKTSSYRGTNNLTGGFLLEINYDLGYLVSSKCGKRRVIFF